jgi:hypothetical protein
MDKLILTMFRTTCVVETDNAICGPAKEKTVEDTVVDQSDNQCKPAINSVIHQRSRISHPHIAYYQQRHIQWSTPMDKTIVLAPLQIA